jgi:hypothetical protein
MLQSCVACLHHETIGIKIILVGLITHGGMRLPHDPPEQSNVKRYEVRRHPMDGDFPRGTALYLVTVGCALQAGQRLSGVVWGMPSDSRPPLLFSPSMIAHALADDEHLAQALLVPVPRSEAS